MVKGDRGSQKTTEDEMVRWHYRLNGHEFEQTPGDSEEQGSLVCCSSWGCRVRCDLVTEQLVAEVTLFILTLPQLNHGSENWNDKDVPGMTSSCPVHDGS